MALVMQKTMAGPPYMAQLGFRYSDEEGDKPDTTQL